MADSQAKDIVPELPVDEVSEFLRAYLIENISIVKDILLEGVTTNFITTDSKLLVVDRGVVVDIQPSFDGLTDNILLENGDRMLFENGDVALFETTVV